MPENGRWYREDMLDNVRKSHQQLSQQTMAHAPTPVTARSVTGED